MARDMEERILQRAYEIWENEGCPDGATDRHYEQAADELTGEDEHETLQELIDEDDREDDVATADKSAERPNMQGPINSKNVFDRKSLKTASSV